MFLAYCPHYSAHCPFPLQRTSTKANRQSLIEESAKAKVTVRDAARLERQKKLAEMLRTQTEAEANGEDVERLKNWEWTIEDNENWEKKLARKARRADYEFHGVSSLPSYPRKLTRDQDDAHAARRRYKKDLDLLKPDLEAYNRQKEQVLGLVAGTLSKSGSSTPSGGPSALVSFDPTGSQVCCHLTLNVRGELTVEVRRWSQQPSNEWLWTTFIEMLTHYSTRTTSLLRTPSTGLLVKSTESKWIFVSLDFSS